MVIPPPIVIAPVYICLLHFPVVNRRGEQISSAVTNLDIHDIARSARTYGVRSYFIVTPIEEQHRIVQRILGHWGSEASQAYHPDRVEALGVAKLAYSFDEVVERIERETGEKPEVVLPDARLMERQLSYSQYREELEKPGRTKPAVIVFGTAWGVAPEFLTGVDRFLEPVVGPNGLEGYRHLSVRAAAGIILDRLLSGTVKPDREFK